MKIDLEDLERKADDEQAAQLVKDAIAKCYAALGRVP